MGQKEKIPERNQLAIHKQNLGFCKIYHRLEGGLLSNGVEN